MKRKEVAIFNVKLLIIWRRHLKIARLGTDGKKLFVWAPNGYRSGVSTIAREKLTC